MDHAPAIPLTIGRTLRGALSSQHARAEDSPAPDAATEPVAHVSPLHAPLLHGPRKAVVVARMWARVAWLAVRTYRNPLRAARLLRRLRSTLQTHLLDPPARGRTRRWQPKCTAAAGRYFWDLYAPGWPSRAFDRYAVHELARLDAPAGTPALNTAIIAITKRCALKCEHCVEWDVLNRAEALSAADLHEIVRRLQQRGVAQFFFSGGEPLARFADLLSLAAAASVEADVWVLTSGLGLTADKARRLRAAGVTGLSLSLDHWERSAHDHFRGQRGAFDAVERAAGHARDAGLLVALSLCPTRSFVTPENLDRYAERAVEFGASFIQLLEPKAVGHYAGQDVALSAAQQRLLEQFSQRLNADPAARALPTVSYEDWNARRLGCKGAGDRYAYIDTDGDLHACPFCRAPGLRVLGHDLDDALARLQCAGCPAGNACATTVAPPIARTSP
jgi:MoaA/NifB/PqqE/SkfB family radical SAM enzyme